MSLLPHLRLCSPAALLLEASTCAGDLRLAWPFRNLEVLRALAGGPVHRLPTQAPFGLLLNETMALLFTLAITIIFSSWPGTACAQKKKKERVGRHCAIRDNHIAAEAMGVTCTHNSRSSRQRAYTARRRALRPRRGVRVARHLHVFLSITFLTGSFIGLATIPRRGLRALFIHFLPTWPRHLEGRPVGHLVLFLIASCTGARRHRRLLPRGVDPDDPASSCKRETPVTGAAAGGARHITFHSKGRTP